VKQELNKVDHVAVIQRFESEQFASNEACLKEYISALAKAEKLDKIMPTLSSSLQGTHSHSHSDWLCRTLNFSLLC